MSNKLSIRLIIALALFTLSCQAFDDLGLTAARTPPENGPETWPHSAFTRMILLGQEDVPALPFETEDTSGVVTIDLVDPEALPPGLILPQTTIPVPLGQAVQITSIHLSSVLLDSVAISVNGQLLDPEAALGREDIGIFPGGYVNLLVPSEEGLVRTSLFQPEWPTREVELSLIWVGFVPGRYELSLVATDQADREGNIIVQQIEVLDPAQ